MVEEFNEAARRMIITATQLRAHALRIAYFQLMPFQPQRTFERFCGRSSRSGRSIAISMANRKVKLVRGVKKNQSFSFTFAFGFRVRKESTAYPE